MRTSRVAIISSLFALTVLAASSPFGDMPECGTKCALEHLKDTACKDPTDIKCLCGNVGWGAEVAGCILTGCSLNDMMDSAKAAFKICKENGVQITLPGLPDITFGGDGDGETTNSGAAATGTSGRPYSSSDVGLPLENTSTNSPTTTGYPAAVTVVTSGQPVVTVQSTATLQPNTNQGGGYYAPTPTSTMTVHPTVTVPPKTNGATAQGGTGTAFVALAILWSILAIFV